MLRNTIAAINDTKRKIKLGSTIFSLGVQVVYLAYIAFCILSGLGNVIVNTVLGLVAFAYLIFDLSTRNIDEKETKLKRKKVSKVYRRAKLVYGFFPILSSVYAMYSASAADVKPIAIITTTIMIILWIVRAILELAVYIISRELDILKAAFLADLENAKATISKPIDAVGDFVKGVAGRADDDASGAAQLGRKINSFFRRKRTRDEDDEQEFSYSGRK